MKKNIAICNTPLMLINFLNLGLSLNINRITDLILTDECVGMDAVASKLKELGIFNQVYFINIKDRYKGGGLLKKIRKSFFVYEDESKTFSMIDDWEYTDFYFSIYDIVSNQLFNILSKYNSGLKCIRYEEGYSDYVLKHNAGILYKFVSIGGFFSRKSILQNSTNEYYLYHPDWLPFETNAEKKTLEPISRNLDSIRCILNQAFGYLNQASDFQKKYVFFEESFSVDAKDIDDIDIIQTVIETVGCDQIIIKPHPRSDKNRFANMNVAVSDCNIPWEIILLNGDFNNTTFISISSGSIVNSLSWNINNNNNILLYKVLPRRPKLCDDRYDRFLELSLKNNSCGKVYVPKDILGFRMNVEVKKNENSGFGSN